MNLGAGRVAVPDLPRIDKAIEDGSLAKNPILDRADRHAEEERQRLPPDGPRLAGRRAFAPGSSGGARQHDRRARACRSGSTPSSTAATRRRAARMECLEQIAAGLKKGLPIRFATVGGRYYAMDRDKRWERVEKAYDAWSTPRARRAKTPKEAVDKAYAAKLDDEFVLPTVIDGYHGHEGRRRPADVQFPLRPRARDPDRAARSDVRRLQARPPGEVRRCRRHGRVFGRAERAS